MFKKSAKRFIQAGSAIALAAMLTVFSSCGEKQTPESLFKDTIRNEVKELSNSSLGNWYTAVKNAKFQDAAADVNFKFELGDGLKPLLRMAQSYAGFDLSFLNDVSLDYKLAMTKDLFGGNLVFNINDKKIISANAILDSKDEAVYISLPELLSKTFLIQNDDIRSAVEEYKTSVEASYKMFELLPAKASADKLVNDLVEALLSEVKDVTEKDKTISVKTADGEISVDCKELSFKVDSDSAEAMEENIKKTLSSSKEFDKILDSVATYVFANGFSYYYDSAKEFKDDIRDEVIDAFGELIEEVFYYNEPTIVVYADNSKNLQGIKLVIDDSYFEILYPNTKKEYGIQITYYDDYYEEEYTVFNGYCKKSGNKSTGSLKVSYEDTDYLVIDLDNFSCTENGMLGTVVIKPTYDLIKEIMYSSYYYDLSFLNYLADSKITIEGLEANKNSVKCKISYEDEYETEYFHVYVTSKTASAKNIKVPKNDIVDLEDMEAYEIEDMLYDVSLEQVATNLEKAGAPTEITSELASITLEDLFDLFF